MTFAAILKHLREVHHITQEKLARHLKVTRSTVAGYETKGKQPDYEKLIKIAEFFNVSTDYLLTGFDNINTITIHPPLNPEAQDILFLYEKLSPDSRERMLDYANLLQMREKIAAKKK